MTAPPLAPAALAQLGAFLNAALAGQVVTQADLAAATAPLATKADLDPLAAQVAALPTLAQFNALAAQVAALPTLAQIQAAIAAALAPHNAPAIAAAASATVQAIVAARAENSLFRDGVAYVVVPRADGTPPPSWPAAGLDRAALRDGPIAVVDALLGEYGLLPLPLPLPVNLFNRRNALAAHIGAAGL